MEEEGLMPPYNFAGLYGSSYEKARFVVLMVPFDSTTTWRAGARDAPFKILEASRFLELYDEDLGVVAAEAGIYTLSEIEPIRGDVVKTLERVEKWVYKVVKDGKFPVLIGGEHSVSIGGVRGVSRFYEGLAVVVFDSHCDFRDKYEGSKYSHACSIRRISEIVDEVLVLGVRSVCEEDVEGIRNGRVSVFWADEVRRDRGKVFLEVLERLGGYKVYLSVDLDVIDPSQMPSVGTPEPDGLEWGELASLLCGLCLELDVVGIDFVEGSSCLDAHYSFFSASKLMYKVMGAISLRRGWV